MNNRSIKGRYKRGRIKSLFQ